MNGAKEQQLLFFDRLKEFTRTQKDVVGQLAELLGINRSSVYKRMRGEVQMRMHEAERIAAHFKIPFHLLHDAPPQEGVPFLSTGFLSSLADVRAYLTQTDKLIDARAEGPRTLYYSARDLPLFWYFASPNLFRFKLGVWLSGFAGDDKFYLAYASTPEVEELVQLAQKLFQRYLNLHTVELWTKRTIINMVNQIMVYFTSGKVRQQESLQLAYEVQHLLARIRKHVATGWKSDHGKYDLYHVDFLMMTNSALYKTKNQRTGFISYAGINYLSTRQVRFCKDLEQWFQVQMNHSKNLSGGTVFEGDAFFNSAELRIRELITYIRSNEG
jgi:transcriptional regulator with XRE-family HTH domain